ALPTAGNLSGRVVAEVSARTASISSLASWAGPLAFPLAPYANLVRLEPAELIIKQRRGRPRDLSRADPRCFFLPADTNAQVSVRPILAYLSRIRVERPLQRLGLLDGLRREPRRQGRTALGAGRGLRRAIARLRRRGTAR